MSAPELFALQIPLRAHALLRFYWPDVAERPWDEFGGPLATTFIIALAGQMLNVPYERVHNTNAGKDESRFDKALADLIKGAMAKKRLDETVFYRPGLWRYRYVEGKKPLSVITLPQDVLEALRLDGAVDAASACPPAQWWSGVRNALAHHSLAYLDHDGRQIAGAPTDMILFVAEHRVKQRRVGHHVFRITRDDFRRFFDDWISWLQTPTRW